MRVVAAPDGFGGTLSPAEAARAIAAGWRRARPDDEIVERPLSDGGEGLLDALAPLGLEERRTEVAGPHGHPVVARWLTDGDTAVIESAQACGLALVPAEQRSPMPATTYGVGQLIDAARRAGARRIVVGLGGSATVDGGAGALTALGFRLRVADGSGLKVGAADLHRLSAIEPTWVGDFSGVEVELLADTQVPATRAAEVYGPQKGATPEQVSDLTEALGVLARVLDRDLAARASAEDPGTGAAGALALGLAAGLGARLVPGAGSVADLLGLGAALAGADAVVTGEGRLDATSATGKVVSEVLDRAARAGARALAVVGSHRAWPDGLADLEDAAPDGPGEDPAGDVAAAASRLAARAGGAG